MLAEFNATVTRKLIGMGRCSHVVYKELFLTEQALRGAHILQTSDGLSCVAVNNMMSDKDSMLNMYANSVATRPG